MNERLKATLRVCHSELRVPRLLQVLVLQPATQALLVIREISWFVLNPKQADLPTPPLLLASVCGHINKHCPPPPNTPCWLRGWSSEPPTVRLIPCWQHSVNAMKRLSQANICCSESPANKEGGWDAQWGAWRRDERGCRGRIPVSAGWSDWMWVTTTAVVFAKSFLKLTMWPVEGQAGQEIEVNDVVTY